MPISNPDAYGPRIAWTTLAIQVKRRAGWQCECGGECGQDHGGQRCPVYQTGHQPPGAPITDRLAAAHIYRTLETCQQGTDLVALCPACHAAYDKRQHVDTRTVTRDAMAGQTPMFPVPSDLGCEFDLRPPLPDQQALDTTDLELESLPAWAETCRDHVLRARDLAATAGADRGDAYLEGLEAIQVLRTAIEHLEDVLIREAHTTGLTDPQIGAALGGLTRQAVARRRKKPHNM